jgi:hypothetical protein
VERLTWKMRISVLWLCMAVATSAHSVLSFVKQEVVEQMWQMQMGTGMVVMMALFWLIPLVMAVLTLILKDSASRWTNIVLGVVFTLLNIWHLFEHLAPPMVEQILIVGSTVVATTLIPLLAWKWPKHEG